jgi:hypothetical protein
MKPGLKIIFDHSRGQEEHAKKLLLHHLKESDKKYPRVTGAPLANVPKTCACGKTFWTPDNADRWDCYDCAPPRGSSREVGFS